MMILMLSILGKETERRRPEYITENEDRLRFRSQSSDSTVQCCPALLLFPILGSMNMTIFAPILICFTFI